MDDFVKVEVVPERILGRIYYKDIISQDDFVNLVGCIASFLMKQVDSIGIQPYRMSYLVNIIPPIVYAYVKVAILSKVKKTERGNLISGKKAIEVIEEKSKEMLDEINRTQHYFTFKPLDFKSIIAHVS